LTHTVVKHKTANLCDVNNYRATAITNTISKILEHILFNYIVTEDEVDRFQFGFKKAAFNCGLYLYT